MSSDVRFSAFLPNGLLPSEHQRILRRRQLGMGLLRRQFNQFQMTRQAPWIWLSDT